MIKHLIKVDGELFEIPLKVYNHLEKTKQRADELENNLKKTKGYLNDLWINGDATEHEFAFNTLKYIEKLEVE